MREFPCKQEENHLTTGDALPPHRFLAHRPLVHPMCTHSFMPHLSEQLSSAIQPGPATLINGIQCPLRDKILLCPTVSSKTSTGNTKDGGLEGPPQLFRISQSTQTPQISTQLVCKPLSCPLILELAKAGLVPFSWIYGATSELLQQAGGQY